MSSYLEGKRCIWRQAPSCPGQVQGKSLSAMLPPGTTASGQYVIAVLDAANVIAEQDETNNVIVFGPMP
ncbi:MAG: hypothetical protein FIA90_14755 [candidate division NC10 bacterium]|nr:hypothetical protein [candidate division NC10 bacterium]